MALMARSKTKHKGPAKHKAKLKPKGSAAAKRKAKGQTGRGVAAMDAELTAAHTAGNEAAAANAGGDDDEFGGMAVSDNELLDSADATALAAGIEGDTDGAAGGSADKGAPPEAAATSKNRKKKLRKKKVKRKQAAVEFEASRGMAAAIAEGDPAAQADWLWNSYSAATGAGADQRGGFDGSFVVPMGGPGRLEDKLKAAAGPEWQRHLGSDPQRPNGAPHVLLIASSAAGANDLIKKLPLLHQACKVAKLFAKHLKVGDQQAALLGSAPAIGVGTPHRLAQLAGLGALKLDRLQFVLVDVALDAKQRTILDIPETCADFWRFFQQHWGPRLAARQSRIGLFNSQDAA